MTEEANKLPAPAVVEVWINEERTFIQPSRYSAEEVRQAMEQARMEERERCARLCEPFTVPLHAPPRFENCTWTKQRTPDEIAAAIRSGA